MSKRTWLLIGIFCLAAVGLASAVQAGKPPPPVTREEFDLLKSTVVSLQSQIADLQGQVTGQAAQIADLQTIKTNPVLALADYVSVVPGEINGLKGPHVIFTKANVHVQSGSGRTDDGYYGNGGVLSGLGNLVVGYNELSSSGPRTGSHNFIVGTDHSYTSYSGLVAGSSNSSLEPYTLTGGCLNTASGFASSVSGGHSNTASGDYSLVSGGADNNASGFISSVSGGAGNTASGFAASSVSGGSGNTASGHYASVSGGSGNTASGLLSSVLGGLNKTATLEYEAIPSVP